MRDGYGSDLSVRATSSGAAWKPAWRFVPQGPNGALGVTIYSCGG